MQTFKDVNVCSHVQSHKLVHMFGIHCHVCASSTCGWIFVYFIEYSSTVSLFQAKDVRSKCKASGAIAVLRSTSYCYFSRYCTIRLKCFPYFGGLFFMHYLCEKCYKPITVQYYVADCISWVLRLTLLDL